MTLRRCLVLSLLGLAALLGTLWFQSAPGYMDAEYYFAGGLRLATGHGFSEPFVWNYLTLSGDDPVRLPQASHAYWMPLASLLAMAGMALTGQVAFWSARLGFVVIAASLPALTAVLAFRLTGRKDLATLSGLLAAFPGFYLPYLPTTDTFGLYMLLGGLFLLLVEGEGRGSRAPVWLRWVLLGAAAGLMHLARADGVLWLGVALVASILPVRARSDSAYSQIRIGKWKLLLPIAGYLLVMGPWMARNLAVFGTPLAPGGARALWVTQYNDLYLYPAELLTPERWLAEGLAPILLARLQAAGQNLQSTLAVQGEIFLLPLVLVGLWRLRAGRAVQAGLLAWALTFLVMTLVFPFAGSRGGFFHSGAAVQPLIWAVAPVGLEAVVAWAGLKRGWNIRQAGQVFQGGAVALALLLTWMTLSGRVIGEDPSQPVWNVEARQYAAMEQALQDSGVAAEEVVAVNNPPGYYVATGRPSIVIPGGNVDMLVAAAHRYRVRYLLLEFDQITGAEGLFEQPADRPGLHYLGPAAGAQLYEILP